MNKRHDTEEFQASQAAILRALASALVEATPEWWTEATLLLEDTPEGCSHEIFSEENPNDIVSATNDIFEQTILLQDLFAAEGSPWKAVSFRVHREDRDGRENWRFRVEYTYPVPQQK